MQKCEGGNNEVRVWTKGFGAWLVMVESTVRTKSKRQGTARPEKTACEEEWGADLCANCLWVQKGSLWVSCPSVHSLIRFPLIPAESS